MPIQVTCSACKQRFNAPETAVGKKAKCPKCGGAIVISAAAAPPPTPPPPLPPVRQRRDLFSTTTPPAGPAFGEEDLELGPIVQVERKQKNCPVCGESIMAEAVTCRFCGSVLDKALARAAGVAGKKRTGNWRKTRTGANLVYTCTLFGIIAGILMGLINGAAAAMSGAARGDEPPAAVAMIAIVGALISVGCEVGIFAGQALCVTAPASSARLFAIFAAVCTGVYLSSISLAVLSGFNQAAAPMLGIGILCRLIGWLFFVVFVRGCGKYVGDRDLTSSATSFLIFLAAFIGIEITLVIVAVSSGMLPLLAIVGLGGIVCGLVILVWYVKLIGGLVETIDNRARR